MVEFAQLTPVELLRETQRAAAPDEMVQMHEELKNLRRDQKKLQATQIHDQEHLNAMQTRQNMQRADVERMKERKNLQVKAKALEMMRPLIQYRIAKEQVEDAKNRKKDAQRDLKRLEREVEPSLRAANAKQHYRDKIQDVVKLRKTLIPKAEHRADEFVRRLRGIQEMIKDCEDEIKAEREGDKNRKADVARLEQTISRIKRQMEEEPIDFDPAEYNERIREKSRRLREIEARAIDLKREMHEAHNQVTPRNQRRQQALQELENLRSQTGQQGTKLRKASSDTAIAWEWVQKNQNAFEGQVYGPPIIECSVKDPRYADAVESFLQNSDFVAFTCTTRNDFKILQEQLYGKLKLSDISIRVANRGLDQWRPPVPNDALRDYSLNGWLLDFVAGPEPVLSMLCDSVQLHRTGITLENHDDQQFERLKESQIQSWVAGKQTYRVIRRREYGPMAVSTRVQPTKQARYWTDQPIDIGAERELRQTIGELENEIKELHQSFEKLKEEQSSLRQAMEEVKGEKVLLWLLSKGPG